MKRFVSTFILINILSVSIYSQLYFPLNIGDKFVYNYYYNYSSSYTNIPFIITYNYRIVIDRDTIINSKKYFLYKGMWVRVDTVTGSLMSYDSTNSCSLYYKEKILDSLSSPLNGSSNICGDSYRCNSIYNDSLFGQISSSKNFNYSYYSSHINMSFNRKYNSKFGLTYKDSVISQWWIGGSVNVTQRHTLLGCVINGIKYGDTTITNISIISTNFPNDFSLSQNYPNPFNPTTTISYKVASYKVIRLVVYDILGKEIAVLVNEKQSPGMYEVKFPNVQSANVQLPSGVYFYTLFADGNLIETRKMVLIK
jgi:hypothetical protein